MRPFISLKRIHGLAGSHLSAFPLEAAALEGSLQPLVGLICRFCARSSHDDVECLIDLDQHQAIAGNRWAEVAGHAVEGCQRLRVNGAIWRHLCNHLGYSVRA